MDYEFNAENLQEENYINIKLPKDIVLHIYKGDIGYSIDFFNEKVDDIVYEMGYVLDKDLLDEDEEE